MDRTIQIASNGQGNVRSRALSGPTQFRSTVVKPCYTEVTDEDGTDEPEAANSPLNEKDEAIPHDTTPPTLSLVIPPRKPEATGQLRPQRDRRLPARYRDGYMQHAILAKFRDEQGRESQHQAVTGVLARYEG